MTYELLKSPAVYSELQQGIDSVLGIGQNSHPVRPEGVSKLPYLIVVMKETPRLHPPASVLGVTVFEDTAIGGKCLVKKGWIVAAQSASLHRHPAVWGDSVSALPLKSLKISLQSGTYGLNS